MLKYLEALLPQLTAIVLAGITFLLGRAQKNAEIGKSKADTEKSKADADKTRNEDGRNLIKFYQDQVTALTEQIKVQTDKVENEKERSVSCEQKLHEYEVRFNLLSTKYTLLEKNLIKNNEL